MTIDLHMHSTASDGELAPAALMQFAAGLGVTTIALTDHDTAAGVAEARAAAQGLGMQFYSGIEVSCQWGKRCIHVVGLGIDEENAALAAAVEHFAQQRARRARDIADKLMALGCPDLCERAVEIAPNKAVISRNHFAQALIEAGVVKNQQEAFDRFLGDNAPAFVMAPWPELTAAVDLIRGAGGVAVLAHPGRYSFKKDWMLDALVEEFVKAGGRALEVVSGSQPAEFTPRCLDWARKYDLAVSVGSDFHSRKGIRPLPGQAGPMPEGMTPVTALLP